MDFKYNLYISTAKSKFIYDTVKLSDLLASTPQYGANEPGIPRMSKEQVRYIRITDIAEWGRLRDDLGATCETLDTQYALNQNDICIARSGNTVGKSFIYQNDENIPPVFAGYMIRFKMKSNLISPKYIYYYLQSNIYKNWVSAIMRTSGQPNINAEEYKSLLIPYPPDIVQKQIVNIMDNAYLIKKEKEEEAQKLLDSIDEYLLDELGIVLPEEPENTLENRMSFVSSNNVLGGRLDPKKYSEYYSLMFSSIENSMYDNRPLSEIIFSHNSGNWGKDINEGNDETDVTALTIRATEFDNRYNLDLSNNRLQYRKYDLETFSEITPNAFDIILEKSGGSETQPVGRVAFITNDLLEKHTLSYSNFTHRIVLKNSVSPQYIHEYLKLIHNIGLTEVMQNQTSGIRNLILHEYFALKIVLPPMEKQIEIANNIDEIRSKAKKHEKEAEEQLKHAKKQVEDILLG